MLFERSGKLLLSLLVFYKNAMILLGFFKLHVHTVHAALYIVLKLNAFYCHFSVFSIGFEVEVGSQEVDVAEEVSPAFC